MKKLAIVAALFGGMTMLAGSAAAMSPAQCEAEARQYADANANPGNAAVGGAVGGGILGAIASSIGGGDPGAGALAGAFVGGVGSVVVNDQRWRQFYDFAFAQCMQTSVAAPSPGPAMCPALIPPSGYDEGYLIGSTNWKISCDNKYKTFDWDSWLFNGFDGCKHYCNL
ncbi:MAG: hypothetical protein ACTSP2_02440 [Alphaproteobacteria bacterium]